MPWPMVLLILNSKLPIGITLHAIHTTNLLILATLQRAIYPLLRPRYAFFRRWKSQRSESAWERSWNYSSAICTRSRSIKCDKFHALPAQKWAVINPNSVYRGTLHNSCKRLTEALFRLDRPLDSWWNLPFSHVYSCTLLYISRQVRVGCQTGAFTFWTIDAGRLKRGKSDIQITLCSFATRHSEIHLRLRAWLVRHIIPGWM
jgi:hypothetical protein